MILLINNKQELFPNIIRTSRLFGVGLIVNKEVINE